MTGPRVRFIVHEAQRSGPPIYALHVLGWLAANTDLDLGVVLVAGGPLEGDFAAICPTVVHATDPTAAVALLDEAEVAYVNTAISIQLLRETGLRPPRVLTHVHELEVGLSYWLPDDDRHLMVAMTDRFLVGPDCAAENLVRSHGVPRAKIGQVPYFVPPRATPVPDLDVRRALDLPDGTIVIGACGAREWRKGPDLFAYLAWAAGRRDDSLPLADALPLAFVWVGSPIPTGPHWDEAGDLGLLDLRHPLRFLPDQADPDPWLSAFDLYALTSREDNFPLACLSACGFGVPVVAFDGGGIPELVAATDGGRVVRYPQVDEMAAAVIDLAADPDRRRAAGDRLARHVAAHHTLAACAGGVAAEITGLVA